MKFALKYRCMTCDGMPWIDPQEDFSAAGYEQAGIDHLDEYPAHELASRVIVVTEEGQQWAP